MSITNYSELQSAVAGWLNRTDLTSVITDFITLAEARINTDVRIRDMEYRATATASTSSRYLVLPDRFLEMRRLQFDTNPIHKVDFVPHSSMTDFYQSAAGRPLYFTIIGSELEFSCTPDSAYTAEMSYWAKVQALSISNTTNAILTNYPNIYLYRALAQAYLYLRNTQEYAVWDNMYNQEVAAANSSDKAGRWSAGPLQVRLG